MNDTPMTDREKVMALVSKRDEMVKELDGILASLDEQGVGMQRTLTTFDGYPRDDVDIPLIRSQRQKAIMLQNDIKQVMEDIRKGLPNVLNKPEPPKQLKPFCYVASVDTPKGLQEGDKIIWFGSINENNHNGLRALPGQLHKQPLRVTVLRGDQELELKIDAGGKLGCRVLPL